MFLDIGVGILVALFVGKVFALPVSAALVLVGILFSLLVDADFIIHKLNPHIIGKDHQHRDLFHYPLLYISIGAVLLSVIASPAIVLIFVLSSFLHFVHDSIGIGWGVQWLYPFDTRHFSFLYIYQPRHKEPHPKQLVYIWKHEEINEINHKFGDPEWVKNVYFKLHPYALVEFLVFVVALIALLSS